LALPSKRSSLRQTENISWASSISSTGLQRVFWCAFATVPQGFEAA